MIIETNGGSKLSFFQDLYKEAEAETEELRERLERHYQQYKGSPKIDSVNGVPAEDATVVRNITYELIESQVAGYIPNPSVSPKVYSEKNQRNAKAIETLLRNKRDELPFEKMNDMDERYNPVYGGSVWLIEWDESMTTHHTVGDVRVSCLSPRRFVGQPNIYEIADMEYCFITFETTKEEIMRRYGVSVEIAEETESDENGADADDDRTATLYVCYYKNDDGKVCQYVWSGDVELVDLDDYYARKRKICRVCGKREELCTCERPKAETQNEDYEELAQDVTLTDGTVIPAVSPVLDEDGLPVYETEKQQATEADGSMAFEDMDGVILPVMVDVQVPKTEPTRIPFYAPDVLPVVIRKNTSEEDRLFGQSDCEFIRPQQQAINKLESRIVKKLMRAGVFPLVPEKFEGKIDESIFEQVFRVKQNEGSLYGTMDLQVNISADIAAAERLYEQAKRILGISDSFQGQYDASAKSGVAKQLQIQQSAGRLDSKRQMKNAAYAEIDRIIFQYYLAYADEPRPATFRDAGGRLQNVMFNRYDFLEQDEAGQWYYNDQYLFRTDATVDIDKSRETLWQENRQNFQSGAYGDPSLPQTQLIFWQNMERAHYPWANDNVERIRAEVEKQEQMAQMQEQMAQMQAQGAQLTSQNQQLSGQVQGLENEIKNHEGYEQYLLNIMNGGL